MAALTPLFITGMSKGLQKNKKPFLLPDQAWSTLYNGYVFRERELKREGNELLGRLQRNFSSINFFLSGASPWSFNILTVSGYVKNANNANPGQITTTAPHNLTTGDKVIITGILGATGYNNVTFTITVVDALNFTVGANAAGFGAYTSGGFFISNRSLSATEPLAEVEPGSFTLVMGGITFTDNGNGTITSTTPLTNYGYINYLTGAVTLTTTVGASTATVLSYNYFPTIPGMGIQQREQATINVEQTVWWDQKYAYIFTSGAFQEFIPGTVWNGNNSDFFWAYNYQGLAGTRLFFVTNFNNGKNAGEIAADPMYYTDGVTWTPFVPLATATRTIYTARIILPYYGRLILLNTWEGTTAGKASGATNFFNRCSFCAYGQDPTTPGNWQLDVFGKGGVMDAPTSEAITGATFVKNTLIVDFEYSTWQLRYVGEYGLPFIWERVSSDFGSGSTFSGVLFDNYRLNVGDVGITNGNAIGVDRIDLDIPDEVFGFQNNQNNNGSLRVWGVRNYQKELIYWNYLDSQTEASPGIPLTFPNKVLLYNYRNNTWAIFRDTVTAFGTFQLQSAITWDDQSVTWDDEDVTWDDPPNQIGFPQIVKLNQQGYAHLYAYQTMDDPSLAITSISDSAVITAITQATSAVITANNTFVVGEQVTISGIVGMTQLNGNTYLIIAATPTTFTINVDSTGFTPYISGGLATGNELQLTIPNHNLQPDEIVYLTGLQFIDSSLFTPVATSLNNTIYKVDIVNVNVVSLSLWNPSIQDYIYDFSYTPNLSTVTYVGGGQVTLFPKMDIISKDINLYQSKGLQTKLSRLDFLLEPQDTSSVTINVITNSSPNLSANILLMPTNLNISVPSPFDPDADYDYLWFSYYQTLSAQYFRIELTYDDDLMNTLSTHQSDFTLYAINSWSRPAGRLVF